MMKESFGGSVEKEASPWDSLSELVNQSHVRREPEIDINDVDSEEEYEAD